MSSIHDLVNIKWIWATRLYMHTFKRPGEDVVQEIDSFLTKTYKPKNTFSHISYLSLTIEHFKECFNEALKTNKQELGENLQIESCDVLVINPETFISYNLGDGIFHALVNIGHIQKGRDFEGFTLLMFDPREGCSNVSLPGLPLGRTLSLYPKVFEAVIFPSFLRYSIIPIKNEEMHLILGLNLQRV